MSFEFVVFCDIACCVAMFSLLVVPYHYLGQRFSVPRGVIASISNLRVFTSIIDSLIRLLYRSITQPQGFVHSQRLIFACLPYFPELLLFFFVSSDGFCSRSTPFSLHKVL